MTQAVALIKRALYSIGAHSQINPAPPEMLEEAVSYLADLVEDWLAEDIDIGATTPTSQNTDVDEPQAARYALVSNLALRLAPIARVPVPPEVVDAAESSYQDLRVKYESVQIDDRVPSEATPVGQGSKQWERE